MNDKDAYIAEQIRKLGGSEQENAICRLVEAGATIVPTLISTFHSEADPDIRSTLVYVIWQLRLPEPRGFWLKPYKIRRRISGRKRWTAWSRLADMRPCRP